MTQVNHDEPIRIALLRSDEPQHVYLEARLACDVNLVGAVVEPGARQRARFLANRQWSAWLWRTYHQARRGLTGHAAYRRKYFSDAGAAIRPSMSRAERITVDYINGDEAREFLERLNADLLIVCGTGYIGQRILSHAPLAINIHNGYLPYYKGNHGIFFALERSDFAHIGVSLHVVNAKLDAGPLLAIVRPEIFPGDNDEILYCRAFSRALDLLCQIISRIEGDGRIAIWEQPRDGRTYRHKDRTPYRELRHWVLRFLGMRRPHRLREMHILGPEGAST